MTTSLSIDLLIRLKNSYKAGNKTAIVINSRFSRAILNILKNHKFIESYSVVSKQANTIEVVLSYHNNLPAIEQIKLFSTPGRRIYKKSSSLPWGKSPDSLIIISTSQGLMSQKQASVKNLGGEVIAEIY